MKITFEEVLSRKEWLHAELLRSVPTEIIDIVKEDLFYDIKLLINGIEVEPKIFNDVMCNIKEHIRLEAKSLIKEKMQDAENKASRLAYLVETIKNNLIEEFNLDEEIDF